MGSRETSVFWDDDLMTSDSLSFRNHTLVDVRIHNESQQKQSTFFTIRSKFTF